MSVVGRGLLFVGLGLGMSTLFVVSLLGVANGWILGQCVVAPLLIATGVGLMVRGR